uniref:hypothetical protein n=1 Tax=Corynebacterium resistens TaxID=258224 RepID=UPI00159580A9|nr:hypothetical protein [Corynebacterium resistens]
MNYYITSVLGKQVSKRNFSSPALLQIVGGDKLIIPFGAVATWGGSQESSVFIV